jgi:hypothetical protein
MSTSNTHSYSADHPHNHHHNTSTSSPSPKSHRLSLSSPLPHLTTLTHAPAVFLGSIHRHEREIVINHQARVAKKEANAAIEKYEAGFSQKSPTFSASPRSSMSSPSRHASISSPTSPNSKSAARAAMGAGASEEDEAEWAAIVAARAAATRRSPTQDLELRMAEERRERILREVELEGREEF